MLFSALYFALFLPIFCFLFSLTSTRKKFHQSHSPFEWAFLKGLFYPFLGHESMSVTPWIRACFSCYSCRQESVETSFKGWIIVHFNMLTRLWHVPYRNSLWVNKFHANLYWMVEPGQEWNFSASSVLGRNCEFSWPDLFSFGNSFLKEGAD